MSVEIIVVAAVVALLASRKTEGGNVVGVSDQTKQAVPSIVGSSAWRRYDPLFQRWAAAYSVPWKWLKAFSLNESLLGTDPRTARGDVSSDGLSWGIMQVTLSTAIDLGAGPIQGPALNDPDLSVKLAAKLVASLSKQFSGEARAVVMSYNEGAGNFRKGKVVEEYWARWQRWMKVVEENP